MTSTADPLLSAFAQRFAALDNTALGYAARQRAWQNFQQAGLPGPKTEAYKYTPITKMLSSALGNEVLGAPAVPLLAAAIEATRIPALDAYTIVLHNGQLSSTSLQSANLPATLQVMTFAEAHQRQGATLLPEAAHYAEGFAALNAALFDQGILIHLADNTVLDKPLVIYHFADGQAQQPMAFPRIAVVGGKNSQASILTVWDTLGKGTGWTNALTEVSLAANAHLDYYTLQLQPGPQAHYITNTLCQQGPQSVLNAYTFTWGGALVRNNLHMAVNASHTETNLYGLYCLQGKQHVDNHTQVDHRYPHTNSLELYKGVVTDQATGVFNGSIYVRQAAQKTHAFQTNNNWVLSDEAKVYTKPQLEIWADDVKCSHGATTGQLDPEQLFYLRARGLPAATAQQLLLQAFAREVLDKVSLPPLQAYLQEQLATCLQAMH
ncbi:MAG: Fe-S cluster assembly protein SufD [Bacteroidota bacterium]